MIRGNSISVLIVEDDYLVSEMVRGIAQSIGYTVVGMATNGVEAVAMTSSLRPDVVIMDIRMPDMDGIEATKQICATCPTPVVVLTAYETPDLVDQASTAGVAAYLLKPPQARELERAITVARARFNDLMELRRLKAEAEAAVRARDELFALISHDLRTPLSSIKGYAELVGMILSKTSPEAAQEVAPHLSKIDTTVRRITSQVSEFLDISRLRTGQVLHLQYTLLDLVAFVRQVVDMIQLMTDRHTLQVDTMLPQLFGQFDADRLERVISNLLTNAIKYSPKGGEIVISLTREEPAETAWAVITVRDKGIGISAADLAHIFEPFHRAQNANGRARGMGLGLASVQQIVTQHGGTIDVVSEENNGSTFTVRLPLMPPVRINGTVSR